MAAKIHVQHIKQEAQLSQRKCMSLCITVKMSILQFHYKSTGNTLYKCILCTMSLKNYSAIIFL